MANELDQTIEELEAEVLSELEEAAHDAPKNSAGKAAPMDKVDSDGATDVEGDIGGPTPTKDANQAGKIDPAKKVKKDSSAPAKTGGAAEPGIKTTMKEAEHDDDDDEDDDEDEKKMSKDDMINAMYGAMKKMDAEKLAAAYQAMDMHSDKKDSEEDKKKTEAVENRLKSIDVSEHVSALVDGEGDLSEEFKSKAATIFEAAVKSKVRSEVERMEDEYKTELEENITTTKDELTEKVDTYLNYVVEEWMKENELAIERGLKGEIAEDFISGLKQLFEDHYVDVPDEKYDVLEAQSEKISELEGRINEMMEEQIQSKSENAELVKEQVMSEVSSDLADTEVEKFKGLVEDVDFSNAASYRERLETLKESYFPAVIPTTLTEEDTFDDVETGHAQDIDTSDSMAAYMSAIGRTAKSAK
jgi:hypothetical protein